MEHSRPRLCPSSLAGEAPAAPWLGDRHLAAGKTNTRSSHPPFALLRAGSERCEGPPPVSEFGPLGRMRALHILRATMGTSNRLPPLRVAERPCMCEPVHKNGLIPLSRAALRVYTIAARIKRLGFRCCSAKQRFQRSQPKLLSPSPATKYRFGGRRRRRSRPLRCVAWLRYAEQCRCEARAAVVRPACRPGRDMGVPACYPGVIAH